MNYLGIEAEVRNLPELDRDFFPLYKFNHAFLASAAKPVGIAVERSGGEMASVHTFIHGTAEMREADRYYIYASDGAAEYFDSSDLDTLLNAYIEPDYYNDAVEAYLNKASELLADREPLSPAAEQPSMAW